MEALPEEIAAASDLNSQLFYEDAMDSFTAEEKLIVTERLWGYKRIIPMRPSREDTA